MKPGQASKTAVLVAAGRAIADGSAAYAGFSDPTAFTLLPVETQRDVIAARAGEKPRGLKQTVLQQYRLRQAKIMAVRSLLIDAAVVEAASPQVVLLGAGLDGRAFRMTELAGAVVFEVDHPDSQRDKRARLEGLAKTAREVRFVGVDFTKDDLGARLAAAGHDRARPTTWIWEGVVMYLELAAIEATLSVLRARSAPGSSLLVLYHAPSRILGLVGFVVGRLGEPLRSRFTAPEMQRLLAKFDFAVVRDLNLAEAGRSISRELGAATSVTRHLRLATAIRL